MTAIYLRTTLVLASLAIIFGASGVHAQERSYHYEKIDITADVRTDSTIQVEEKQTYRFAGEYHEGYRSIPHKALGAITDVQVFDAATGEALEYAYTELERESPESWGKYTYYESDGETVISWYFDAKDISHTWILKYVVHGAIGFYREYDELYWNAFTDYDVPVDTVSILVRTPGAVTAPQMAFYTEPQLPYTQEQIDERQFLFTVSNVPPEAEVTFAVGWQKGLVDQRAFWMDFFKLNAFYIYAFLIALAAVIYSFIYERQWRAVVHGKGTIIPQYEPPLNLQPAEAEMIVKGTSTDKAWAATIVDLAVRGYVSIKAEEEKWAWGALFAVCAVALVLVCGLAALFAAYYFTGNLGDFAENIFPFTFFVGLYVFFSVFGTLMRKAAKGGINDFFTQQDYIVTQTGKSDADLEEYEKAYLRALMEDGVFSTKKLRKDTARGKALYLMMQAVKKTLQDGMQEETSAYARPPGGLLGGVSDVSFGQMKLSWKSMLFAVLVVFAPALIPIFFAVNPIAGLGWVAGAIGFAVLLISYKWYWKVRLNTQGEILKEEWLGFKLYLEKAEQYRLQNLTPETFEKYLPYAIIFGVEKEWGKAFSNISMPPPSWYSGSYAAGLASSGGGFSASAFSSSFSASFASSISSSGGGGSGGGGGAGGGGGGGGGGAR